MNIKNLSINLENGEYILKDDNILYFNNFSEFPVEGIENTIYIDKTNNAIYRWNVDQYVKLSNTSSSEFDVINLDGGNSNSVYTDNQLISCGGADI